MRKLAGYLCAAPLLLSGAGNTRPNLVLVTVDTLRPDRLGCYGNSKVETPNLDKIAKKGVLFENAVTHTPLTAPSHASIFTGLYPTGHKVRDTGGFVLDSSHKTLAAILYEQGWDTAAFVGSSVLKRQFGFDRGFEVYDDKMPKGDSRKVAGESAERRAGEVVDKAAAWLTSQSGKPFFLWVHVCSIRTRLTIRRRRSGKDTGAGCTTEKWLTRIGNWGGCSQPLRRNPEIR